MSRKLFAALAVLFSLTLAQLVGLPAAAAAPETQQVRTLYYDASGAAEFKEAVDAGAKVWNDNVQNVKLEKGSPASITVLADDGWPRAQVRRLGEGTWWMGRQAVNDGHDVIRIAAHEFGHLLGLPDRRTGLCEDLMSGASAGTSCKNPNPNDREKAEVERNFGGFVNPDKFHGVFLEQPGRELVAAR